MDFLNICQIFKVVVLNLKKLYFNKKLRKMIKKAAIDDMNEIDDDFN